MKLQNNKGFSLVEVLISIVVLAILFVAAMNAFATVAKVNAKANTDQKASTLAQNILESLETLSYEKTIEQFHGTDFNIISSNLNDGVDGFYSMPNDGFGEYMLSGSNYIPATAEYLSRPDRKISYLALKNVSDNGTVFDVMIRLDAATYSDSKYVNTMNNFEMPNLLKLDANKVSIIDLKNDADTSTISNFVSQYTNYLNHLPTPSVPPGSLSNDIKSVMNKSITLNVFKNSSSINLGCNVSYNAKAGTGIYQQTYTYSTDTYSGVTSIQEGAAEDGNIYLFYTPSIFTGRDSIKINNNGAIINFYLVNQTSGLATNINVTTSDSNHGVTTVYTNYQGTLINGSAAMNRNLYGEQDSKHRIYDIKVSVYPKGTLDTHVLNKAYVTFQSAKEN